MEFTEVVVCPHLFERDTTILSEQSTLSSAIVDRSNTGHRHHLSDVDLIVEHQDARFVCRDRGQVTVQPNELFCQSKDISARTHHCSETQPPPSNLSTNQSHTQEVSFSKTQTGCRKEPAVGTLNTAEHVVCRGGFQPILLQSPVTVSQTPKLFVPNLNIMDTIV